ncbi:MAG TPA: hypothetical protein DDX40_08135 [Rikenellaceae bacterium]|nr:hypothetical protein [Rikenellaceae bacterium]
MNIFKGKIDEAYLKGFLNASYTAEMQHNPNSAVNTFRSALGPNRGTLFHCLSAYLAAKPRGIIHGTHYSTDNVR